MRTRTRTRTLEEVRELLKDYEVSDYAGHSLGCRDFVIDSYSLDAHFARTQTVLEMLELTPYNMIFVRKNAEYRDGEDGINIYTRLQFGIKGKSLTPEQYKHLNHEYEGNYTAKGY